MDVSARVVMLSRRMGRPLILKAVHDPRPGWRGQLMARALWTTIEYQDPDPGYFWDEDLVHELLDHLEAGETCLTLWEGEEPTADRLRNGQEERP